MHMRCLHYNNSILAMAEEPSSSFSCGLYLATSTIPNAGLGIFTAHELHRGDSVMAAAAATAGMAEQEEEVDLGDIVIPLLDLEWHNAIDYGDIDAFLAFPNPFRDYVWEGRALGMDREAGEFESVTAFWPGLDAAINCFAPLVNLERSLPDYDADLSGQLHRSRDPAMGSFSPYSGGHNAYVKEFVPAGGELFKDYGDAWFLQREMKVPVGSDIPKAERLLHNFARQVPTHVQPDVYQLVAGDIQGIWAEDDVSSAEFLSVSSRVLQAIPDSWSAMENIVSKFHRKTTKRKGRGATTTTNTNIQQGLRDWYQTNSTRSLEWLEQHGTCLDTIRTAPSTIAGAGRGAFSKRSFAAGEVVTTSPLIHLTNRSILNLHEIGPDPNDPHKYIQLEKVGEQLAINYCFSHPETTLALCPYAARVNSINHAPSSSEQINLRVEWPQQQNANNSLNHNATYLAKPLSDPVWDTLKPQLVLQYVATRPIAPGDELFLSYGPEWEQAWERHVKMWQQSEITAPLPHGQDYISAEAWNRHYHSKDILWTADETHAEAISKQVPPFLELRCHTDITSHPRSKYYRLQWEGDSSGSGDPEYGRPCRVVERKRRIVSSSSSNSTSGTTSSATTTTTTETHDYKVVVQTVVDWDTMETEDVTRYNVPRRLLKWFDQPHTTDLHLSLAFRHFLGLPDELVSKEWRNNIEAAAAQSSASVSGVASMNLHEPVLPPGHEDDDAQEAVVDGAKACPAADGGEASDVEGQEERKVDDDLTHETVPTTASLPDDYPHSIPCDLYLAPSSIPGAGLGIFAGRDHETGDDVGSGDVAIPLFGMAQYYDDETENPPANDAFFEEAFYDVMFEDPFEDYVWDPRSLGLSGAGDDVGLFWPGINAAVNCYPALINLEISFPTHQTAGVHRYLHPGAGAFSPYHEGTSKATRHIPTGSELFKEYGPEWFLEREGFDGVPVVADFDDALEVLKSFFHFLKGSDLGNKPQLQPPLYDSVRSLVSVWKLRLSNALPETLDSARDVVEKFGGDFGKLHQPNRTRDVSWLEKNGRCLDHIFPKQSTLEGAGMGAFAKRFLPQGTMLTASPLIHVRRHKLAGVPRNGTTDEGAHEDLLLNYCYGASESSLLLCPYSNGVNYINHNQTMANVQVQWAAHTMGQDNSKFEIPPWHFDYMKKPSLSFDYVVIRDIEPDEEIFLDYGEDYELAWNRHVAAWKPEPQWESYMMADDFNKVVLKEDFLRTALEQENDPYPENVIMHCHSTLLRYDMQQLLDRGVNVHDSNHMQRVFPWYDVEDEQDGTESGFPCEITGRRSSNDGFLYDVSIATQTDSVPPEPYYIEHDGVPRNAMRFFDRFQSSDIHLKSSFRHAIGLPKEMIPSAWKDLAKP